MKYKKISHPRSRAATETSLVCSWGTHLQVRRFPQARFREQRCAICVEDHHTQVLVLIFSKLLRAPVGTWCLPFLSRSTNTEVNRKSRLYRGQGLKQRQRRSWTHRSCPNQSPCIKHACTLPGNAMEPKIERQRSILVPLSPCAACIARCLVDCLSVCSELQFCSGLERRFICIAEKICAPGACPCPCLWGQCSGLSASACQSTVQKGRREDNYLCIVPTQSTFKIRRQRRR